MSQAAYEFQPEGPSADADDDASATEQVKAKAQQVVGQVHDTASTAKEQVGDKLSRMVQERSNQTGEQAIRVAESLRQSVGSMREQGQEGPARLAEQAADRVQAVGLYLRDNDGDSILRDIEDFARRQPIVVGAAAFAVGFLGARFLKASSARRQSPQIAPGPAFSEHLPTPPAIPTDTDFHGSAGMGVGTVDEVAPPPIDPAPNDVGGPSTPGTAEQVAPPTTPTP